MLAAKKTFRSIDTDIRVRITERFIKALEAGVKPWQRPWEGGMVKNVVTKKDYNGINIPLLALHQIDHSLSSPIYGTYQQWLSKGSPVKQGSKGAQIVLFKPIRRKTDKVDEEGQEETKGFAMMRMFTVFAADQTVDGDRFKPVPRNIVPDEECERVVKASGAKITHGGQRACYSINTDAILLPPIDRFNSVDDYHGTQLHELIHWTGHKTRCDRKITGDKATQGYAYEELVAEIGGCFLMGHCGLEPKDVENHASYLGMWLTNLKNDPKFIFSASAAANKASTYVLKLGGYEDKTPEEDAHAV